MSLYLYLTVCGFDCSCNGNPLDIAILTDHEQDDIIKEGKVAFNKRIFKYVYKINVTGHKFGSILNKLDHDINFNVNTTNIKVYIDDVLFLNYEHNNRDIRCSDYDLKIIFNNKKLEDYYNI